MQGIYVLRFSVKQLGAACVVAAFFACALIVQAATITQPVADKADDAVITASADESQGPDVRSTTYAYQSLWYAATSGTFTWDLPEDVEAVAVEVATSTESEPMEVYEPPISSITLNDAVLHEGTQYLALQLKDDDGWGDVVYRQILIDRTDPEPFLIETTTTAEGMPKISFSTSDALSGVERYEVLLADQSIMTVSPMEARSGVVLKELDEGVYSVLVKAYDRAGNSTLSATTVHVGVAPNESGMGAVMTWSVPALVAVGLLIMVAVFELFYILYLQRRSAQRETELRKEAHEVTTQMQKIFSALRDEIHDQINSLTKRPRLSKKEKEVVGGLHKALEVSEQLIEKEVHDVTDVLK